MLLAGCCTRAACGSTTSLALPGALMVGCLQLAHTTAWRSAISRDGATVRYDVADAAGSDSFELCTAV
jgi:hypothetical protein